MPIYEYGCPKCGVFDRYLPFSEYDKPQTCECGEPSKRMISIPMVFVKKNISYESPIDGHHIGSYREWKEDMARNNCVEYDPDIKQEYQRNIERGEQELEKIVDSSIEEEISKMPNRKREMLENELKSGADAIPERITPSQTSFRSN